MKFLRSLLATTAVAWFAASAPSTALAQGQLPDFADLVEKNGATVVNVSTKARGGGNNPLADVDEDDPMYEFYRRFFQMPPGGRQGQREGREPPLRDYGQGSGFIVTADGYILTNAHVVRRAEEITVTLNDKREFKAKLVGADDRTDTAVLKIEATGLPSVRVGNPDKARVGEWVLAIGSPFGLENTVTAGIISSKGRATGNAGTGSDIRFIQTDVAVNPGNSGGPLFNLKGEVIGINSQIYSRSGGYQGISFAIPIDVAMNIYNQLRTSGKVTRGRIGVQIGPVTRDVMEALGLTKAAGAYVADVVKDSPAAKAGIVAGDVITRVDGREMEDSNEVRSTISRVKPGTKVTITVVREGKPREIAIVTDELVETATATREPRKADPKAKGDAKSERLGVAVADLTDAQKKELKVDKGAAVQAVSGASERVLRPGEVIVRLNNTEITSAKQFRDVAAKVDIKKPIALLVRFMPDRQGSEKPEPTTVLRILRLDE